MTMMRLMFAAEKAAVVNQRFFYGFFNPPLCHEVEKLGLIVCPWTSILFVSVKHLLGGSKFRSVNIFHSANLIGEIFEIVPLGKTRELRNIIQANIYNSLCA